jgi:hypothetical protein
MNRSFCGEWKNMAMHAAGPTPSIKHVFLFLMLGVLAAPVVAHADLAGERVGNVSQESPQRPSRFGRGGSLVYKDRITPHWFQENKRFWYRNDLRGGAREFVLVDTEAGTRRLAFDHDRLAAALTKAAGAEYRGDRLPFDRIAFSQNAQFVLFEVGETTWECDLSHYVCRKTDAAIAGVEAEEPNENRAPPRQFGRRSGRRRGPYRDGDGSVDSSDGKWSAFLRDYNVFVRPKEGGEEI